MHSSSDIHTVTYLSKEYGTCWVDSFGPAETCGGVGVGSARVLLILPERVAIMLN